MFLPDLFHTVCNLATEHARYLELLNKLSVLWMLILTMLLLGLWLFRKYI